MWFWCWACFKAYTKSPVAHNQHSLYGRFQMWLLGYAGCYAHCDIHSFHLCNFFHRTDEEQDAAWDRHLATLSRQVVSPEEQT
jgi:hypothetical protein